MSIYVEDRIAAAKLRTLAPISQNTFEESDLVTIATDEMLLKAVSDLRKIREDFFLSSKSVPIVADVDYYGIPSRAVGNTLVAVFLVDSNGGETPLERIEPSRRHEFSGSSGTPAKFYLSGDEVVLVPKPQTSTQSLLMLYERKPNRLISTSSCAKITGISTANGETTFDVDTDLTTSILVGQKVDFLSTAAPFLLWASEVTVLAISSNQIQVSATLVSNAAGTVEPQVGDYICPAGYANIPMLPEEYLPVLDQMVAVRLLAALGDLNKWNTAKAELKEMRAEATALVKNRVQSSPLRVSARNGLLSAFQR